MEVNLMKKVIRHLVLVFASSSAGLLLGSYVATPILNFEFFVRCQQNAALQAGGDPSFFCDKGNTVYLSLVIGLVAGLFFYLLLSRWERSTHWITAVLAGAFVAGLYYLWNDIIIDPAKEYLPQIPELIDPTTGELLEGTRYSTYYALYVQSGLPIFIALLSALFIGAVNKLDLKMEMFTKYLPKPKKKTAKATETKKPEAKKKAVVKKSAAKKPATKKAPAKKTAAKKATAKKAPAKTKKTSAKKTTSKKK